MQYKNNIQEKALAGLMNGITQATNIVKKTMGAAGTNVILEIEQYPYHEVTNDGATVIEKMWFEDPLERMGVQFLKEVVGRSNKNAGDGSTTTTVLVESILKEGIKQDSTGIEIKKSLDECIPIIEESIKNQKKMITSDDFERLKQVATISSEDENLGELLAKVYGEIGSTGIIEPEYVLGKEGNGYNFIQGVRFANLCGYLSPIMVHDEEAIKENRKESRAVYDNPMILITKQKIKNVKEIDPIIKLASKKEKDLVIFTDDMDTQVVQVLTANHQLRKSGIRLDLPRITIVKAPTVWKDYVFEDFAKCTGATIVCDATGISFKTISEYHLGTCDKIIIEKDETRIIGTKDLTDHIKELQFIVDNGNDRDDDALRRVGWLTAKTILLKIGGLSETELTYKRLKAEDAINATRSSLIDGIVCGGGIALLNASKELPDTLGGIVLREALKEPTKQIIFNAGHTWELKEPTGEENGFDAITGKIVNMYESGIIDSARITLNAVKNSIGIASTILTASSAITLPPKEPKLQMMMPNMPGM